jgi:MoxR-like ATPase
MSRYHPKHFKLPDDDVFPGEEEFEVEPYIFSERIAIAVDVALATDRPLLVAGPPGCGKSRLAETLASMLGWHYLAKTMTSRTRLEELTVEIDHLRRLHDAHRGNSADTNTLLPDAAYHNPGIFWWAFNPTSAHRRGLDEAEAKKYEVNLTYPGIQRTERHCVLLIDEIDKAEPDLPNDLLEPLDQRSFGLPDGTTLAAEKGQRLLILITTNGERELPQAFLRRCVSLRLEEPNVDGLITIAGKHHPDADATRVRAIAERIADFRQEAERLARRAPGTSEFLDAVRACQDLNVDVDKTPNSIWSQVERAVLLKHTGE